MRSVVLGLLDKPWYRGFTGVIEPAPASGSSSASANTSANTNTKLRSRGVVSRVPGAPTKVRVTELPIGYWTEDFKEALEALIERAPDVKSFSNESTDSTVCFAINLATQAAVTSWLAVPASGSTGLCKLEAELKLASPKGLSTTNMHLFNAQGQIKRYETVWDILSEFYCVRLAGYESRRLHLIARLRREVDVLFVESVVDGRLKLDGRAKKEDEEDHDQADRALEDDMEALGLERLLPGDAATGAKASKAPVEDGEEEVDGQDEEGSEGRKAGQKDQKQQQQQGSYRYLLTMPMASMTARRKAELDRQLEARRADLARAEASRPRDMWAAELDRFDAAYRSVFV
jgi:DNA topoisomerase-2